MYHGCVADRKFCALLLTIDEAIAARVKALGCPWCSGRLDRADYPRKPRGGSIAAAGEEFDTRISLCCSREGCRKRVTPPSVRFLGRRVYLGVTVVVASAMAVADRTAAAIRAATGIAPRTVRRWLAWWRTTFVASPFYADASARFVPPVKKEALPASLVARFRQSRFSDSDPKRGGGRAAPTASWPCSTRGAVPTGIRGKVLATLSWLAPCTTESFAVPCRPRGANGARFLEGGWRHAEVGTGGVRR